jgi:dimethylamine/trimethylamine dehydrogenase
VSLLAFDRPSGYLKPKSAAALRAVKAEGGWGVVRTEYCSIQTVRRERPNLS